MVLVCLDSDRGYIRTRVRASQLYAIRQVQATAAEMLDLPIDNKLLVHWVIFRPRILSVLSANHHIK